MLHTQRGKNHWNAMMEAQIFGKILELMPLEICRHDLFAGRYRFTRSLFEEACGSFGVDPRRLQCVESKNKIKYMPLLKSGREARVMRDRFGTYASYTTAHTCIDYATVLKSGLEGYREKIIEELAKRPSTSKEYLYLQAMKHSIEAVYGYAERYARLALEQLPKAETEKEKAALARMGDMCRRVPRYPAKNIHDAFQSIWIMHSVTPVSEKSWASISLGRFDQYLYPFYRTALEEGMEEGEMEELVRFLFELLDSYGDGACALNIGGESSEGMDMANQFSELILRVEKEVRRRAPIVAVRITEKTPQKIWDTVTDIDLFQVGQPTFYGERPCRSAMAKRGLSRESNLHDFAVNSCMGLVIPGEEIADMWGCMVNMHLPLELALNGGKPIHGELPVAIDEPLKEPPASLEEVLNHYGKYMDGMFAFTAAEYFRHASQVAEEFPNPLLSALTKDCIERGLDRAGGGARYHNVTVEAMGFANTADALTAVDELVFKAAKYSLEDLISAVKGDYAGREDLLLDLKKCPKYGTGNKKADGTAKLILKALVKSALKQNRGNIKFIPSCHTLDKNVSYGKRLPATLDGRRAGEPVNKNAGPALGVRSGGPTALLTSAAALEQESLSGGQPVDLYISKTMLKSPETKRKFQSLLKTYFSLGGLQVQVNSVNLNLLKEARENPGKYRDLIVRKGGYSVYFTDLKEEVQEDFILRCRQE